MTERAAARRCPDIVAEADGGSFLDRLYARTAEARHDCVAALRDRGLAVPGASPAEPGCAACTGIGRPDPLLDALIRDCRGQLRRRDDEAGRIAYRFAVETMAHDVCDRRTCRARRMIALRQVVNAAPGVLEPMIDAYAFFLFNLVGATLRSR